MNTTARCYYGGKYFLIGVSHTSILLGGAQLTMVLDMTDSPLHWRRNLSSGRESVN